MKIWKKFDRVSPWISDISERFVVENAADEAVLRVDHDIAYTRLRGRQYPDPKPLAHTSSVSMYIDAAKQRSALMMKNHHQPILCMRVCAM